MRRDLTRTDYWVGITEGWIETLRRELQGPEHPPEARQELQDLLQAVLHHHERLYAIRGGRPGRQPRLPEGVVPLREVVGEGRR